MPRLLIQASAPLLLPFNMTVPTMEAKDREELLQAPSRVRAVRAVHEGECPKRQLHRDSDVDDSVPLDGSSGPERHGCGQEQTDGRRPSAARAPDKVKWTKGDAKGDSKQDLGNLPQASGKGSSGKLLSKAAVAMGAQTGSDNASSPSDRPPQELTTLGPKASPPSPPNQDNPAPCKWPRTTREDGTAGEAMAAAAGAPTRTDRKTAAAVDKTTTAGTGVSTTRTRNARWRNCER